MNKNLIIEFDPTMSKGIRQSAKYLGLKTGEFIVLGMENLLRHRMENHPQCPLSEQLDPGLCKTLPERVKYILKLFVAWQKAIKGVEGFEIKTIDQRPMVLESQ